MWILKDNNKYLARRSFNFQSGCPSGLGFRVIYTNNGEANERDSGKLDGHFGYRTFFVICMLRV